MRWRINDFVFCEGQQTLTTLHENQKITQQLEPIVVELLAYFCKNPDQIISRTELIDSVWCGRMITDNAVNKVITKLRKSFNDDSKTPRYIATFPKKGYKFIADVALVNDDEDKVDKSHQVKIAPPRKNLALFLLLLLLPIMVVVGVVFSWKIIKVPQAITQVEALTRDSGRESRGQISPNGNYLSYIEVLDKKMHQWIKSLTNESKIEINHGNEQSVWVDSVSWNSDGSEIVYLVTTPKSCQYFIRSFNKLLIGEPELIHNCPSGSYGKIAFTHDDNRLVYTESEGPNTPFSLFEMNLKTGSKRRLNQPQLFLGGNSQFDLHPTKNKLLISSPDKQQWEGFYELNLDTDVLTLLFKQNAFICCGIWDHTGKRVVLMGEHPAHEIVSFNLQGHDRRIVYSGSEQLRVPERHINGVDYLFSVVHVNQDAAYLDFKTGNKIVVANTTVDERLASFAYHNNQVAYIGLSSGNEEVWVTDIDGKERTKLTQYNDSRHYIDLKWSYDGEYLLGLTLNEIHLINSETGLAQALKLPQVEIRGISWKSDNIVSYSIKNKDDWQVNHYDIRTHIATTEDDKWEFIRYAENPEDTLSLDLKGNLFFGSNHKQVMISELQGVDFINGRTFNIKKQGSKWVWQISVDRKYQLMLKENLSLPAIPILVSDSLHFDLSMQGILYHTLDSMNADIYKTMSQ